MDILSAIGLALPAGLNAYIPLLGVAVAQRVGFLQLNEPFSVLGEWWAIGLISLLLLVEVFADKVPAVDSINDAIQTVVRPVTGALVAVGASGQAGERYPLLVALGGILLAGGVHAMKATSRPAVNLATGGTGGPVVSIAEDLLAVFSSIVAILVPALVVVVIGLFAWLWWSLARRRGRARAASG